MTEIVLVLTTMPDDARADALARALVEERLAACVSIGDPMTSIYRWQDAVEQERERQLVVKTSRANVERLRQRVTELHPYDVPEFLVIDVAGGGAAYLDWVSAQTSSPSGT